MTRLHSIVLTFLIVFGVLAVASAQDGKPVTAAPPKPVPQVPLEVEVVITRYDGAKKLSSLPYMLAVNANAPAEVVLNMGTQVAVPTSTFSPVGDEKTKPLVSYNYRDVGTRISSRARTVDGGFDLTLNIDDSSVYTSPVAGGGQMPAFRTFSSRNTLLLRDGQMREYTAATDRVSGEVVKISVTLKVVK